MDMQHTMKTLQTNLTKLMNCPNDTSSMRKLSTCIGCSDSYIQKLMSNKIDPSLSKLTAISNYFDIPVHVLLDDSCEYSIEIYEIIRELESLPKKSLDAVLTLVQLLNKQNK